VEQSCDKLVAEQEENVAYNLVNLYLKFKDCLDAAAQQ
jgi:hypothetical protein